MRVHPDQVADHREFDLPGLGFGSVTRKWSASCDALPQVAGGPRRCYFRFVSEYPKGRTWLGDQIAAELAQNPNSPRNRAKRAAEEARSRQTSSEYPTGRTGLGDLIAAELAQNPNSPRNRAKRAAGGDASDRPAV